MKKFKLIDAWLSMILISSVILYGLIQRDSNFIYGYFLVGGWQLTSIMVHVSKKWFTHSDQRKHYHIAVAVIACIALVGCLVNELLWALMFVLFFVSPIMAIYYTWLCYQEVYVKMQRPLAALK